MQRTFNFYLVRNLSPGYELRDEAKTDISRRWSLFLVEAHIRFSHLILSWEKNRDGYLASLDHLSPCEIDVPFGSFQLFSSAYKRGLVQPLSCVWVAWVFRVLSDLKSVSVGLVNKRLQPIRTDDCKRLVATLSEDFRGIVFCVLSLIQVAVRRCPPMECTV